MDLSIYLGRKVRVEVFNGFYYEGEVLSIDTDDNSIEIKDKTGKLITLSEKAIIFIREVGEGK